MGQLTIGHLAKNAQLKVETIRYYERLGLLPKPPRTQSGYRIFPDDAVRRLQFIQRAQDLGFSLNEIRNLLGLRLRPEARCVDVRVRAEAKIAEIDGKMSDLRAMRKALVRLVGACSGGGPVSECPILDSLDRKEHQ
jgi:MerR family mercuric resistance operon transcriptional regulator